MSQTVFAAFPGAFPEHYKQSKLKVIGNPVRKEIVELIDPEQYYKDRWGEAKRVENSADLNILVVGGSLGATALNEKVPQALASIEKQFSKVKAFNRINVRHQCGKNNLEQTKGHYSVLPEASKIIDAEIMEFISDMAANYQWADLVICRSGALTVSEIAAAGVASILVPFPFAVDDHQTANGQYLSNNGAAYLIQQKDLTKEKLSAVIMNLDKKIIQSMAVKARKLAINSAAQKVADECLKLAG